MTSPAKPPNELLVLDSDTSLRRALRLPALALFGLVYLVPLTVFTTYGIVTEQTGGRLPLSYIFTLAAMIFTAFSYSAMVRAYPVAGSAYTYTSRSFGSHAGFLAGWSLLLDYLFLPMINYLVIGIYLNAQFPAVPIGAWALIAIVLVTVLNVVGISTIANVNVAIIGAQTVFIVVFIVLAIKTISGEPVDLFAPFVGDGSVSGLGPVLGGAAVLALSFLGFDAVSTMAEEAKDPRRDRLRPDHLALDLAQLYRAALRPGLVRRRGHLARRSHQRFPSAAAQGRDHRTTPSVVPTWHR